MQGQGTPMEFCLLFVVEFYSDREPHRALFVCAADWASLFGVAGILMICLIVVAGTGSSRGTLFARVCGDSDRELSWNFVYLICF